MPRVTYTFQKYRKSAGGHFYFAVDGMSQWHPALTLREYRDAVAAIREEFAKEFASGVVGVQYRNTNVHLEQLELFVKRGTVVQRLASFLEKMDVGTKHVGRHDRRYLSPLELKLQALQKVRDKERDARNKAAFEARGRELKELERKRREAKKAAGIKPLKMTKLPIPKGATREEALAILAPIMEANRKALLERNRAADAAQEVKGG